MASTFVTEPGINAGFLLRFRGKIALLFFLGALDTDKCDCSRKETWSRAMGTSPQHDALVFFMLDGVGLSCNSHKTSVFPGW